VQNVSDAPKLVYVYTGVYGDFGMVKDNKKKLLNGGEAMKPGDKLDFSMQFKYDPEIKSAKARAEGVDPRRTAE
ncbi:hypothetical protein KKB18_00125, partial [bacterium]|nr:hypothetical protein [bacterium]